MCKSYSINKSEYKMCKEFLREKKENYTLWMRIMIDVDIIIYAELI